MALPTGAVIGGYRIIRVLGSGGMGAVYLARHPSLPRRDALKILNEQLSGDPEFRARFQREGSLAASLDHPNIVAVHNRGEEDGRLWIAMQYVPGTDAAEEAKRNPAAMNPRRVMHIISEVGKGLDYAHRCRLLHRDIKPANFLLSDSPDGDGERVLLTDFGVAKSVEDKQDLTATGKFVATVAYASPEQLLGHRLDHRSDIYSLGCSAYRLLTGQNPYPSTVPAVVMMGHLQEPPPNVSSIRPDLPMALDRVFAKVLAKDPQDRYGSCREFVADAEAALQGRLVWPAPAAPATNTGFPQHPTGTVPTTGTPDTGPTGDGHWPGSVLTQPHVSTVRTNPAGPARARRAFAITAAVAVIVIAVATALFTVRNSGSDPSTGPDLARVRAEHPEFGGRTVAAFDYTDSLLTVALDGSSQADFLRDIGFRYSEQYVPRNRDEISPRELSPETFQLHGQFDVLIVLRSDSAAGNGGLGGLPRTFLRSTAPIVVIDDIAAVQAFRTWTEHSPKALVERMVPEIATVLS
ncbi:serine/threonine-protein kinase [Nocardia sp. X0981]